MNIISKYKVVIAIVLPLLILVLIRSLSTNHFKSDAKKWAEPSLKRSNTVTMEQGENLPGKKLIINIGSESNPVTENGLEIINIPADSVLSRKNLKTLSKHDGPVMILSTETAMSVRIWMVLSQMGYENIYILSDNADNEVLKYKFRSDSTAGPEL